MRMQYGSVSYTLGSTSAPGVTPRDIANSLAKINRFTGHSVVPYSVARHSIFVSELLDLDPLVALYGLCHDVAETVVQDLSYPLKQALGKEGLAAYRRIEDGAECALWGVLGLSVIHPRIDDIRREVKRADWVAVKTERRDLMPKLSKDDPTFPLWSELDAHNDSHRKVTGNYFWYRDADEWLTRYRTLADHLGIKNNDTTRTATA